MSTHTLPEVLHTELQDAFRAHAQDAHSLFPHYHGYFDTWVLARVVRDERFKGGSTLTRGMLTLMAPTVSEHEHVGATRSTFDWQTGHVVAMPAHKIVEA